MYTLALQAHHYLREVAACGRWRPPHSCRTMFLLTRHFSFRRVSLISAPCDWVWTFTIQFARPRLHANYALIYTQARSPTIKGDRMIVQRKKRRYKQVHVIRTVWRVLFKLPLLGISVEVFFFFRQTIFSHFPRIEKNPRVHKVYRV